MTMMLARILDAKAREESTMGLDARAAAPGLRHCDLLTLAAHLGRHTEENMLGYAQVSLMLAALFHEGPALEDGMDEDADPEDLMADFGWGTGGAARGAPESSGELGAEVGPPSEVGGLIGARELAAGVDMRGAVEILCRIACNGKRQKPSVLFVCWHSLLLWVSASRGQDLDQWGSARCTTRSHAPADRGREGGAQDTRLRTRTCGPSGLECSRSQRWPTTRARRAAFRAFGERPSCSAPCATSLRVTK